MQRLLIVAGIVLLVLGIAWPWLSKLPFGRPPRGSAHRARRLQLLLSADHRARDLGARVADPVVAAQVARATRRRFRVAGG
jgi:hypothetical protein